MSESCVNLKPDGKTERLADRLGKVHVGVRGDLDVTRHRFRGEAAYVVRDPLTFQSHRFDVFDYSILVALDATRPLKDVFQDLVEREKIEAASEDEFYAFVLRLHRFNFLSLPISEEKMLYGRFLAKEKAKKKGRLLTLLFYKIPVCNPNAFLDRTMRFANFAFTRWFFMLWLLLMATAGFVVIGNYSDLSEPLQGVLAAGNLPLIWIALVLLKLFHEFGHAYACKRFGGYVPEMGMILIVLTPCAYVDASASWGFERKRDRIIVCLAGMYIESLFAALAVLIWAASPAGMVRDLAFNVMFLASVVTVLFNINPLMRYDGYYVLSDLLEMPNLRQKSNQYVIGLLKRWTLGLPPAFEPESWRERILFITFGISASIYKVVILVGIAALLAAKLAVVGFAVGAGYLGATLVGIVNKTVGFLWFARETAPIRGRAIAVSVFGLMILPVTILMMPSGLTVNATGTIEAEEQVVIRAPVDGFLSEPRVRSGETVETGTVLVELRNDDLHESLREAESLLAVSRIRHEAYQAQDPVMAQMEAERIRHRQETLTRSQEQVERLTLRAPITGRVLACVDRHSVGRFLKKGEPVASVGHGGWLVRVVMTEDQFARTSPRVGQVVEVRRAARPWEPVAGRVTRIAPTASRTLLAESLSSTAGGEIPIDPETKAAGLNLFVVTLALEDIDSAEQLAGMTCRANFDSSYQSLGRFLYRSFLRFSNTVFKS